MKIKCAKIKCPVCSNYGSCQIFFNRKNEIRYARVRHAISKDSKDYNANRKYNFNYCKLEEMQQLKTLLKSLNLQFPTVKAPTGHKVADQTGKTIDHGQTDSSSISKNMWAGSSARIEHHPPKTRKDIDPEVSGLDLIAYRNHLLNKFTSRSYAKQIFSNSIKYFDCIENPQRISEIPASTRGNVLKAMANLSKFLGVYSEYKQKLKKLWN